MSNEGMLSYLRHYASISTTRNFISEDRKQRSNDRIQITDAGNQIAWIVHFRNPFDPPRIPLSDVLLYALCPMLYALFARNPQLETTQYDYFRFLTPET
jgi:hypothetical protein